MKRTVKQVIIASTIILIILVFVAILFWSEQVDMTCFDGIQNQKEENIDCGGPCEKSCEPLQQKKINVLDASYVLISGDAYNLIGLISNDNPNYGSGSVEYKFNVFSDSGNLIKTISSYTYILSNQIKYVVLPGVKISQNIGRVEMEIIDSQFELLDAGKEPKLLVSSKDIVMNDDKTKISGIVQNSSSFDYAKVNVVAVLKERDTGKILLAGSTVLNTVLAGEMRMFYIEWPRYLGSSDYEWSILAETNVFDASNYYRKDGGTTQF